MILIISFNNKFKFKNLLAPGIPFNESTAYLREFNLFNKFKYYACYLHETECYS